MRKFSQIINIYSNCKSCQQEWGKKTFFMLLLISWLLSKFKTTPLIFHLLINDYNSSREKRNMIERKLKKFFLFTFLLSLLFVLLFLIDRILTKSNQFSFEFLIVLGEIESEIFFFELFLLFWHRRPHEGYA